MLEITYKTYLIGVKMRIRLLATFASEPAFVKCGYYF
jgi:hypothetical protein